MSLMGLKVGPGLDLRSSLALGGLHGRFGERAVVCVGIKLGSGVWVGRSKAGFWELWLGIGVGIRFVEVPGF